MLPAPSRMRRSSDFDAAVRTGRRAGRSSLVVHLRDASPADGPPKVGLVVSRAVGPAVVRNQVKRRLRHLAAERLDRLPSGSLVVLRANPPAAERDYAGLGRDLDGALTSVMRRREDTR